MDLFTTFIRLAEEEIPQDRIIDGWDLRQDFGIVSKEQNGYLEWIKRVWCYHCLLTCYMESPDSAVLNIAVPDLVRFQNRTKLSKFPDIVRFFPEKLPIFVPKWSRFGQNIKVPV